MAYVQISPDDLEQFALLADSYAKTLRGWKETIAAAHREGVPTEINGITMLKGNIERELERLILLQGQFSVIASQTERAIAGRGAKAQAAKPPRKGKG
jgi:hypothetical protein